MREKEKRKVRRKERKEKERERERRRVPPPWKWRIKWEEGGFGGSEKKKYELGVWSPEITSVKDLLLVRECEDESTEERDLFFFNESPCVTLSSGVKCCLDESGLDSLLRRFFRSFWETICPSLCAQTQVRRNMEMFKEIEREGKKIEGERVN